MASSTIKKVSAPDLEQKGRRNSFDWTHRRMFTALHGQLTPAVVMDLKTGDYVELQNLLHTRTQPVLNNPFVRLREHLDYFFVPYSQLWKAFDNFITQQSNYDDVNLQSTLLNKVPQTIPYFTKAAISDMIHEYKMGGTITNDSETTAKVGLHRVCLGTDVHRLASYLGYFAIPNEYFEVFGSDDGDTDEFAFYAMKFVPNLKFNPFRLAAYQKIYFDYYRNDKYEACDSEAYNFNDIPCNGGSGLTGLIPASRVKKLFMMRYRWRNKDYFMASTPNILPTGTFIGFEGIAQWLKTFSLDTNSGFYQDLQGLVTQNNGSVEGFMPGVIDGNIRQSPLGGTILGQNGNSKIITSGVEEVGADYPIYSASEVRWLLSYERLLKRMYAAKNNFFDQMKAIFGDAPIDYRGGNVQHIGGMSNVLAFDTTFQTNLFGGSSVPDERPGSQYGQIDSKNQGGSIKFRAHECGVLMGIYSTSTDNDYAPFRVDRFNFKLLYQDFFNPNFQTMGKQPLVNFEFSTISSISNEDPGGSSPQVYPVEVPKVIGFVERYHEYKIPIDSVLGDFVQGSRTWVCPYQMLPWADQGESLNQYNMTIAPDDLTSVFGVNAQQGFSGQFLGDQFKIELVLICDKVSEMDYIGDEL